MLCDLDNSISLKYCKIQKEYRCLEDKCSMSEFISLPRYKKHLADKHFVETEMGRNNAEQMPHITRVIPENQRGGKFKCDRCLKRFYYKKDLQTHGKRCNVNLAVSPSNFNGAHHTAELQPIDLSQMNFNMKVSDENSEAPEIRIISSKHELSSSEPYSRPQANETTPTLKELTPAHVPCNPFSVSLMLPPSNCTSSTIIPNPNCFVEVREFDSDKNGWYYFILSTLIFLQFFYSKRPSSVTRTWSDP